jgi:hypothetical protein
MNNMQSTLELGHSQNLACGKGGRSQLCEAPAGSFRQLTTEPFTTQVPESNGDEALERSRTKAIPPTPATLSPTPTQALALAVCRLLRTSQNHELQQLKCEFRRGTLTLHGRVSSFYLKQMAQETVRDLVGVERIHNELEVTYAPITLD